MHRASTRQAELDAQILRERRIGRRLIGAPEAYTALGERPGRALLGGIVAGAVIALVVAVVAAAGSARDARQGAGRARTPPAAPATAPAVPPGATTAPPGVGQAAPGGTAPAQRAAAPGATTADGQPQPQLATAVSVGPAAVACRASADEIEVTVLFTEDGVLGRVELTGIPSGCVGREVRVSVLGEGGAELDSRVFVPQEPGSLGVGGWRARPLTRAALRQVVVEIL
jgi:hypothetical protein